MSEVVIKKTFFSDRKGEVSKHRQICVTSFLDAPKAVNTCKLKNTFERTTDDE